MQVASDKEEEEEEEEEDLDYEPECEDWELMSLDSERFRAHTQTYSCTGIHARCA